MAFSPDSRLVAAGCSFPKQVGGGSKPGEVILWETDGGRELDTWRQHREGITSVAFSPDGLLLATASRDHLVGLWHVEMGMMVHAFRGHAAAVTRVAFSPDGRLLASGGEDQAVCFWDVADLRAAGSLRTGRGGACSLAFSPDGKLLAAAWTSRGPIVLCDATSRQERGRLQLRDDEDDQDFDLAFSPDGALLAAINGKTVFFWDMSTWQVARRIEVKANRSLAWSPDGTTLATAGWGTESAAVRLWNTQTGERIRHLNGHQAGVASLAFSPDGQRLAAAGRDMTVQLWELGLAGSPREEGVSN